MSDAIIKPCPFCGDPMFRGKFGDSIQHVDQGKCLIGSMAVPVERIAYWNARATAPASPTSEGDET